MKLNHIIIGAGRSGTTTLDKYVQMHDGINSSSIKEVNYFSIDDLYERGESYLSSFFDANKNGPTSTSDSYLLMDKNAPKRIYEHNPDIKLTVILRNPTARTLSSFNYAKNHGYIDKDKHILDCYAEEENYLKSGDIGVINNHCHFNGSLYYQHLQNWLQYFLEDQFFITTTDELKRNPAQVIEKLYNFIGVESISVKQEVVANKSSSPKSMLLDRFLVDRNHPIRRIVSIPLRNKALRKAVIKFGIVDKIKDVNRKEADYQPLSEQEKAFAEEFFKDDLSKLQDKFGISFG